MNCTNKVSVYIERGFGYREIKLECGSTNQHGMVALCERCENEAMRAYPQGWQYHPGDTCKHGTYLNPDHDCCCGQCEMGE